LSREPGRFHPFGGCDFTLSPEGFFKGRRAPGSSPSCAGALYSPFFMNFFFKSASFPRHLCHFPNFEKLLPPPWVLFFLPRKPRMSLSKQACCFLFFSCSVAGGPALFFFFSVPRVLPFLRCRSLFTCLEGWTLSFAIAGSPPTTPVSPRGGQRLLVRYPSPFFRAILGLPKIRSNSSASLLRIFFSSGFDNFASIPLFFSVFQAASLGRHRRLVTVFESCVLFNGGVFFPSFSFGTKNFTSFETAHPFFVRFVS